MIDFLYSRLAKEKLETFVEVFAGGASLGLSLLDAGVVKKLILNDKDIGVYSLWQTILTEPDKLVDLLRSSKPTHKTLFAAKRLLKTATTPSSEVGWAFLLANRLCFSGIVKANPLGGRNGSEDALLSRWNPIQLEKKIMHIYSMRDRIELHNMDAACFVEQVAYWNRNCTCFIDPPYYEKGASLYQCYFSPEDHKNLAELLQALYVEFPESDLIITYDNHPYIRELYSLAQKEVVRRRYSIR